MSSLDFSFTSKNDRFFLTGLNSTFKFYPKKIKLIYIDTSQFISWNFDFQKKWLFLKSISNLEIYKFLTNWCIKYVRLYRKCNFWKKTLAWLGFEPGTFCTAVGRLTNWSNWTVINNLLIQLFRITYLSIELWNYVFPMFTYEILGW